MSDYAWQPVEDGAVKTVYGGDIDVAGGTELYVYVAGRRHTKQLRADYRLCRRVPAELIAGAPVKAREALRMAVQLAEVASDWHLDEVEIDGEMMSIYDLRDQIQSALDAQPQTGQGGG